jgi:hypothetical protein
MEELTKQKNTVKCIEQCKNYFDNLKDKLVFAPILIFCVWSKLFYVHVDASNIVIGTI